MATLEQIATFLKDARYDDESKILTKAHFVITLPDIDVLRYLSQYDCFNQIYDNNDQVIPLSDLQENQNIGKIEFPIHKLRSIHLYTSFRDFIKQSQRENRMPDDFYILDIECSKSSGNAEITKLDFVHKVVDTLKSVCDYKTDDQKTLCVSNNHQIEQLPIIYDDEDIRAMPIIDDSYEAVLASLRNKRDIISKLYIQELLAFIQDIVPNNKKFAHLIRNIADYQKRCICSQEVYVQNFSFNEVKTKIDNAVLDFSDKLQNVINGAQERLIAIPAAFILAIAGIDKDQTFSLLNIAIVIGVAIFAVLILLFLRNQKDALDVIDDKISEYKATYHVDNTDSTLNEVVSNRFSKLDRNLSKQFRRICMTKWIVIAIPTLFVLFLCMPKVILFVVEELTDAVSWAINGLIFCFTFYFEIIKTIVS